MKTFTYKNYKYCFFYASEYKDNGRLFLGIKNKTDGFIANVTINVPEYPVTDYHTVFIKNYSENEGMLDFLLENQFLDSILAHLSYGDVVVPVVQLNVDKVQDYLGS